MSPTKTRGNVVALRALPGGDELQEQSDAAWAIVARASEEALAILHHTNETYPAMLRMIDACWRSAGGRPHSDGSAA